MVVAILGRLVHSKRFEALESAPTVPDGWDGEEPLPAAQAIGDAWCDERRGPELLVPSAVTPSEYNLIVMLTRLIRVARKDRR